VSEPESIESHREASAPEAEPSPQSDGGLGVEPRKRWHQRAVWRLLIVIAALVLIAAWRAGSYDHVLVNVGLNAKPCARNGFGATFCGSELEEYRAHVRRAREAGEAAESKIGQFQRQSEEASQRAQEFAKRSEEEAARVHP
jgi:hypothetical protein